MRSSTDSTTALHQNSLHVTYQIAGFDRPSFVSDIANVIPQDGTYLIRTLCFEADGVQANGVLTIQMQDDVRLTNSLVQRLRSVRGLVSVQQLY